MREETQEEKEKRELKGRMRREKFLRKFIECYKKCSVEN